MHARVVEISASIRDHFLADHDRLEALFERLLGAVEAGDREEMARLWTDLERGLFMHLRVEESSMIPALQRVAPTDARVLLEEHRHIRTRLTELGVALDLHTIRLESVRAFVDELRAHAKSEDRLLYRWAEERLDHADQDSALRSLLRRQVA